MPTIRPRPACTLGLVLGMLTLPGITLASNKHGDHLFTFVQGEQFEYRGTEQDANTFNWDIRGWAGGDYQRLWFKTQGAVRTADGPFRGTELQLRYSQLISPFWELAAGGRFDSQPELLRGFAVIALHGLTPYLYEVDADLFVSHEGAVSARLEVEYPILLTQRLILQPSFEINVAAQDVPEAGVTSGLSQTELGIRLRYEFTREFAPYVGLVWDHKAIRNPGPSSPSDATSIVAGVRWWF